MNLEYKQKWLEKLRNGQYKQGRKRLCHNDKHCCLGVLCNVVPEAKFEVFDSWLMLRYKTETHRHMSLPLTMLDDIQLSAFSTATLMRMNDDGKSFAEIADWIEANL
jgi:hypothetical protein